MPIHRLARRRPSPALIVACLVLFVALGGTSYALAIGSIGSAEVRDGSLGGNDMRRDGIGGGAIKEQTLAGVATSQGLVRQLIVRGDGGSVHARGVASVDHPQSGIYRILFDDDIDACVPVATLTGFTNANPGLAGTGEIAVETGTSGPRTVSVQTAASDGHLADRGFQLLVSC